MRPRPGPAAVPPAWPVPYTAGVLSARDATTSFLILIATTFSGAAYIRRSELVAGVVSMAVAAHAVEDPALHSPSQVLWAGGIAAISFALGRSVHSRQHQIGRLRRQAADTEPRLSAEAGLRVDLDVSPNLPALPPAADMAAYRVVQEALTNTMRHAPGASFGAHIATMTILVDDFL